MAKGIIQILAGIIIGVIIYAASIEFDQNCGGYLKQAADANTAELALNRLDMAVKYAEEKGLTNGYTSVFYKTEDDNIGYWYQNLKACQKELSKDQLRTLLVKTNARRKAESRKWKEVAMKYRQELLSEKERHAKNYIDSVWHSKDERPCRDDYVLVSDGTGFMVESRIGQMQPHQRWAYLKDLLPHITPPVFPRREHLCEDGCTKDKNEWY